jgi:hypothetical protein
MVVSRIHYQTLYFYEIFCIKDLLVFHCDHDKRCKE